jgi:hypothetical protein
MAQVVPQGDVGLHDLGDDLVLVHELCSEGRVVAFQAPNPRIVAVLKGCCAILKEALLPAVEDGWAELVLVREVRHWHLLKQVLPENGDFLLGGEPGTFPGHGQLLLRGYSLIPEGRLPNSV